MQAAEGAGWRIQEVETLMQLQADQRANQITHERALATTRDQLTTAQQRLETAYAEIQRVRDVATHAAATATARLGDFERRCGELTAALSASQTELSLFKLASEAAVKASARRASRAGSSGPRGLTVAARSMAFMALSGSAESDSARARSTARS